MPEMTRFSADDFQAARLVPMDSSDAVEDLKALNADLPDPLADLEQTEDAEADMAAEVEAIHDTGFKERQAKEAERFELATDSQFWTCLCFKTRAQLDAFLAAKGWDKYGTAYLDGTRVAREEGIEIPADPEFPQVRSESRWHEFLGQD